MSLRLERLPHLARLSAGRNNGDNSWSLTLDDLEDLAYLPPDGMEESHNLAFRIVGLDGGGSTLAVLEVPIPAGGTDAQDKATEAGDDVQLRVLRDELAKVKAVLAGRESDLAKALKTTQQAETEKKIGTELAQDQAAHKAELEDRKFTTLSAGLLMRKGEAQPSKPSVEGDELELRRLREEMAAGLLVRKGEAQPSKITVESDEPELRRLREEIAALKTKVADRDSALAEARVAVEHARERRQQEMDTALSKAKQVWAAGEAARLASAEAQWQEKSAAAMAETLAQAEARASADQGELHRLREELAATQTSLADRKTALAEAGSAIEQARARWQHESDAALAKAAEMWKSGEAARLATAEAQWQEKSARALAEARTQAETARDAAHATELRRLREEVAATKTNLVDRETAISESRLAFEQARERWQRESEAALSKAEAAWKAAEAARLAKAEVARDPTNATELRRVREELAAAQASLSERESALAEALSALEQGRERRQRETEAALMEAEKAWKAGEAARLAAVKAQWQEESTRALAETEAQWQEESTRALAEATSRSEAAEAGLKQLRIKAGAMRAQGNDSELRRLREALAATEAMLAERDSALAALQAADQTPAPQMGIVLRPDPIGRAAAALEQEHEVPPKSHLLRDIAMAATLAASAIIFYPTYAPFIPEEVRGIFGNAPAPAPAPAVPPQVVSPVPEQRMAVVIRAVNVRGGPSSAGDVISTLPRGMKLAIIEQNGNWVHVRIEGEDGKPGPRDGWVFNSFLQEEGDNAPAAAKSE